MLQTCPTQNENHWKAISHSILQAFAGLTHYPQRKQLRKLTHHSQLEQLRELEGMGVMDACLAALWAKVSDNDVRKQACGVLYNFLVLTPGFVPTALRPGRVEGLQGLLGGLLDKLKSASSFPQLLPDVMSWIWLVSRLVTYAKYHPSGPTMLVESRLAETVTEVGLAPGCKNSALKQKAVEVLTEMVRLEPELALPLVAKQDMALALASAALADDPGGPSKAAGDKSPGGKKADKRKRAGSKTLTKVGASAGSPPPDGAAGGGGRGAAGAATAVGLRKLQQASWSLLVDVLYAANDEPKVWTALAGSGMLPWLLQRCAAAPLPSGQLPEALLAVGSFLGAVGAGAGNPGYQQAWEAYGARLAPLHAACAPHLLPLLLHADPKVVDSASDLLVAMLQSMERWIGSERTREHGDAVLHALLTAEAAPPVAGPQPLPIAAAAAAAAVGGAQQQAAKGAASSAAHSAALENSRGLRCVWAAMQVTALKLKWPPPQSLPPQPLLPQQQCAAPAAPSLQHGGPGPSVPTSSLLASSAGTADCPAVPLMLTLERLLACAQALANVGVVRQELGSWLARERPLVQAAVVMAANVKGARMAAAAVAAGHARPGGTQPLLLPPLQNQQLLPRPQGPVSATDLPRGPELSPAANHQPVAGQVGVAALISGRF
ncbi:hypothetical protein GPECTOR_25g401 [Gonium pectorale]|uniref:Uncharacterized protein n=1 Tax=Gonium pectorale TaxID=33097 RepID=A0A150GG60_GONPE|nr:hypothetical protein GPECTOR_25g401 [Gonium pectorale]|eukprot:KXZ48816.1 hypothetical protein GPECTOR_25g401 [Gonium pectorale]